MIGPDKRVGGRSGFSSPFPDFPGNARSFVHLDRSLLPYWHMLFDVCPSLLKLDPPEGLDIFRNYMKWAYRAHPLLNWSYYINVCRWLAASQYRFEIQEQHYECFIAAAAANWAVTDDSEACGIVIGWQFSAVQILDWKSTMFAASYSEAQFEVPLPAGWDFGWSPLTRRGKADFRRWLPIPGGEQIVQRPKLVPRKRSPIG